MQKKTTSIKIEKGEMKIYPFHPMVANCVFNEGFEEEAELMNAVANVAEKSGMSANDVYHLFPAILRMLKSDS